MIRVHVQPNWQINGVDIGVAMDQAGGPRVLQIHGDGVMTWVDIDHNAVSQPTLTLNDDIARPLLEALLAHYHGSADARSLRKDYDAERARVDRFIEHLTRQP